MAFMDLGEPNPYRSSLNIGSQIAADNAAKAAKAAADADPLNVLAAMACADMEVMSADVQAAFEQIIPLNAKGILKANIDSRFTIDQIKQAVSRAEQSGRNGKVLIVPNAD